MSDFDQREHNEYQKAWRAKRSPAMRERGRIRALRSKLKMRYGDRLDSEIARSEERLRLLRELRDAT